MNIEIIEDDLSDGSVAHLLNLHLLEMHKYSPPESVHAIDAESLKDPSITFWAARVGGELAACGALKQLSSISGEVKSMKTSDAYLRKGIAALLLDKIIAEAQTRCYTSISLETGTNQVFLPAIALYKKFGFEECAPFGNYELDPHSLFLTKSI